MNWRRSIAAMLTAIPFIGLAVNLKARPEANSAGNSQVTFNRDIAPIVFQNCSRCHRPGESGPFPLLTYEDVKKHAKQIEVVTRTRYMPPWLPAPQPAKFAD